MSPKVEESKKRVSTGIPDLDALLEGGFPVGKSYLITGDPGAGKSIFCMQYVFRGLMDGEKAVYVPVDDKPADIIEQAASLGWDLLKYVSSGQLLILDASPFFNIQTGLSRDKEIDISKTIGDLASYVKRLGASRLVIDPVDPLIASRVSPNSIRERARALVRSLQDNMGTTNLLTSFSFSRNGMGWEGAEDYPVSGVVILKLPRQGKGLIRTLLVSKMRETAIDLVEHPFYIIKEKGIVFEPIILEPVKTPETVTTPAGTYSLFKEWKDQ